MLPLKDATIEGCYQTDGEACCGERLTANEIRHQVIITSRLTDISPASRLVEIKECIRSLGRSGSGAVFHWSAGNLRFAHIFLLDQVKLKTSQPADAPKIKTVTLTCTLQILET